jgi:hypothetical protein
VPSVWKPRDREEIELAQDHRPMEQGGYCIDGRARIEAATAEGLIGVWTKCASFSDDLQPGEFLSGSKAQLHISAK